MFDPMCYSVQTDSLVWLSQLGNMAVVASQHSVNTPTHKPLHLHKSSQQLPLSSKENLFHPIPRRYSSCGIQYHGWAISSEVLGITQVNREKSYTDSLRSLKRHFISTMPQQSRQGSNMTMGHKANVRLCLLMSPLLTHNR